tara:strand:+ start:225826 stop:225954 length:129 start_codon:yes stop_codon:yes gene_type:complete
MDGINKFYGSSRNDFFMATQDSVIGSPKLGTLFVLDTFYWLC